MGVPNPDVEFESPVELSILERGFCRTVEVSLNDSGEGVHGCEVGGEGG